MMTLYVAPLLGGLLAGLIITRLMIPLARWTGWLDYPDCQRKLQQQAVPFGGGVAVYLATLVTLACLNWSEPVVAGLWPSGLPAGGLLVAATLVLLVGVVDDRFNLRARHKLYGQIVAVLIVIGAGGCCIDRISLFGWTIDLGILAVPVTVLWLLACINALNLIDGMDGLLGTVGSIALASFGILAVLSQHHLAALIAFSMLGAVLGFLWWNLPPARIYMGDAGSMLIGLVVGALAIQTSLKGPATVALGAPLAILVLPMFDTMAAVIRRKLTGRGLAAADRGHLHHVLLRHGLTAPRVLILAAVLAVLAAGGALASIAFQNDLYAFVSGAGVIVALVAGKLFGYAEWKLVQKRLAAAAQALLQPVQSPAAGQELAVHLQGAARWDLLWQELLVAAQRLQLHSLCLDVNAPALHENYYACWYSTGIGSDAPDLWRIEVPLLLEQRPLGRLTLTLARRHQSLTEAMQVIIPIIEAAEQRAGQIICQQTRTPLPQSLAATRETTELAFTWDATPVTAKG